MSTENRTIQLDHFLKFIGVVDTGGQAKMIIQGGEVFLNGELETRRKKKLVDGDIVEVYGDSFLVDFNALF
jgi:ribosome-associated protein